MKEIKLITGTRSMKLKRQEGYCHHHRVEVDEHLRMINCIDCNKVIDPYEYVLRWALDESRYEMEVTWKKRELEKLQAEFNNLKEDVQYMRRKKKSTVTIKKIA